MAKQKKNTLEELQMLQALDLNTKVAKTKNRIREWVSYWGEDGVYVSFSGGKDSTVLLTIARELYPNLKACFVDTTLEYGEIREFVKTFDNVDIVRPKMSFKKVIQKYGYPLISKETSQCIYDSRRYIEGLEEVVGRKLSLEEVAQIIEKGEIKSNKGCKRSLAKLLGIWSKDEKIIANIKKEDKSHYVCDKWRFMLDFPYPVSNKCCTIMKKNPAREYAKETGRMAITGQMASESKLRATEWLRSGCNAFDSQIPTSNPMSFWTEQDVLEYIYINKIPICSVYGDVIAEGGCGSNEQLTIFDIDPSLGLFDKGKPIYSTTGCQRTGCVACGFGCHRKNDNRFEMLKTTHPKHYKGFMKDVKDGGLGYKEIFSWMNEHGNLNIKF